VSLGIFRDDLRSETLMCLEASFLELSHFLMLIKPLILHLGLKILTDLKIFDFFKEHLLNELLIDILEMNFMVLGLISGDFIGLQDFQDIFVFNNNSLFFVNIVGVLVIHLSLGRFKISSGFFLPLVCQFNVTKWRRKLNQKADEINYTDPSSSFWIIFHPSIKQSLDIISSNYTRVFLFSLFETFNNCGNTQVKNKPRDKH
jgi:hypothetical protein